MSTSDLEYAAATTAEARLAADSSAQALITAVSERDRVLDRIQSLQAERSGIVTARQAGDDDPDHGPRLALIAADVEGLQEILADRTAKVGKARAEADESKRALTVAEQRLTWVCDQAALLRLVEHADKVSAVLHATITEAGAISKKLGERPRWVPPRALADEIRRLDLMKVTVAR